MNNRFKFRLCYTDQTGNKSIHYTNDRILIDLNGVIYENYGENWKHSFWETIFDANGSPFIQQYTGLKDKLDKEIYEGDIIKYHQDGVVGSITISCVKYFIAEIVWHNCAFHIVRRKFKFPEGECDTSDPLYSGLCSHIEVIGNIFENKDLLKL